MGHYPVIAREGIVFVLICAIAAFAILHYVGFYESLVLWAACLLLVVVFRDPDREIPAVPLAVVSPADGKVTSISVAHDPYLARESVRIVIQMNPYGVYTTRSPIEGKVLEPPNIPEVHGAPHGVWLQADELDDVVLVMNRGPLRNTPRCYVRFGERVGQGQRCGFIHLGGQVELYLPTTTRTLVTPGDLVRSGSDVIAKLVHA